MHDTRTHRAAPTPAGNRDRLFSATPSETSEDPEARERREAKTRQQFHQVLKPIPGTKNATTRMTRINSHSNGRADLEHPKERLQRCLGRHEHGGVCNS